MRMARFFGEIRRCVVYPEAGRRKVGGQVTTTRPSQKNRLAVDKDLARVPTCYDLRAVELAISGGRGRQSLRRAGVEAGAPVIPKKHRKNA
jgi:hypothetical protein